MMTIKRVNKPGIKSVAGLLGNMPERTLRDKLKSDPKFARSIGAWQLAPECTWNFRTTQLNRYLADHGLELHEE